MRYDNWIVDKLKNNDLAVSYLNAALDESIRDSSRSHYLFLLAIKNVAQAKGGIGELAKKTGLGRESLYKSLSEKGNPKWVTVLSLLASLGMRLKVI